MLRLKIQEGRTHSGSGEINFHLFHFPTDQGAGLMVRVGRTSTRLPN